MPKQPLSFFKTIWTTFNRWMLWVPLAAVLAIAGCAGWYQWNLRPTGLSHPATFRIAQGESVATISSNLKNQGFIRNAYAFEVYITLHGIRRHLQSGIYSVPAKTSAKQIAAMVASGQVDAKRLTIPEGTTLQKIHQLAEAQGISDEDFSKALTDYRNSHSSGLLAGVPANIDLEGYLFPDTYTISGDTPAADLVSSMIANTEDNIRGLTSAISAQGLTTHQALTLASIVEKEVAGEADRKLVAGIFLNRIRASQRLQSDVTVIYAANLSGMPFSTSLDSPYNTYRVDGLPVGPICNPGLSALSAVAHPTFTNYHYFLAGKDGKTHYAVTFEEHEQNIAKYLR